MNKTQKALKMAIEQIKDVLHDGLWHDGLYEALKACKEALAELQEQKPVAWMHRHEGEITKFNDFKSCDKCEPLYTSPPKCEWRGLSDEEIAYFECLKAPPVHPDFINDDSWYDFARAIEQALKEKNY